MLSIVLAVTLMILLLFGNKVSIHSPGEKSQEQIPIQQNNLEKKEGRLSGIWHYSVHQTSGPGSHSYSGTTTINQRGSSITITVQGWSVSGTIHGNSISISGSYSNGSAHLSGTVVNNNYISFSITVQADGQRWTGDATFTG